MLKKSPLWREALKNWRVRNTFGSWDVEKVLAVVVRSTCPSQNVQNTPRSWHFWKLRCSKSGRRWREAHLEVKMYKALHVRTTFGRSDVVSRGRRKGLCTLSKVSKTWRFCCISMAGVGHLKRICKNRFRVAGARDCAPCQKWAKREGFAAFRWQAWDIWRGSAKIDFAWQRCGEVRRLISWEGLHFGALNLQFWEHDFAWQVQHFVWPDITFSWQAQHFRQMEWKHRKTHWHEAVSSALKSTFYFWRTSCIIASFLTLPTSKNEEASQTCFVFDVIKFKNWSSLAELLHFSCCHFENGGSLPE